MMSGIRWVAMLFCIPLISSSTTASASELDGYRVISETIRTVTAYNVGDPRQTSGAACLSANERNLCRALKAGEKHCAANFVPLGSLLYIDGFGLCRVSDRTNSRYQNRVDIAMPREDRQRALEFGRQQLSVKIVQKKLAGGSPPQENP